MTNFTGGSAASAPPPPAPAEKPPAVPRRSELRTRILSALCLAPVVLWAMWRGGEVLQAVLALTCAVALGEWAVMTVPGRRVAAAAVGAVGGVAVFAAATLLSLWWLFAAAAAAGGLALLAATENRVTAAAGAPYVIVGCVALAALAAGPEGRAALFFVVLVVWATDIGAYAAGRGIGGPKLAPRFSPKKTWAGLLGGMAAAAVVAALTAATVGGSALWAAALLGAVLAVVAQVGDLFESWGKRRAGVKDSSRLIPGHGGLLDRIDGLLTAAPALALYQAAVGPPFA